VRALGSAGHADRALRRLHALRERHDDALDRRHRAQRVHRPLEQRSPRNDDERLGSLRPKALASSCSD
jgi:hypothetical protein